MKISLTTAEIAALTDGELDGSPDVKITGFAPLDQAGPNDLSYVAEKKHVPSAAESGAGALLTGTWPIEGYEGVRIVCDDPQMALVRALRMVHLAEYPLPEDISPAAHVSPSARLGENVSVGAGAVIEDEAVIGDDVVIFPLAYVGRYVRIGARSQLQPHTFVGDRCVLGEDVILHAGCTIGGDGFGFIQREGKSTKIPHVAAVRIGNDVEMGALSTADRGMLTDTVIGDGVKIDDHCHVAHNCTVGDHTVMAGYARIAGSTHVGKYVMMGGDARVPDHVTIGDRVVLAASAAVSGNIPEGQVYFGIPARPASEGRRIMVSQARVPEMLRRVKKLEKEVEELRAKLADGGE